MPKVQVNTRPYLARSIKISEESEFHESRSRRLTVTAEETHKTIVILKQEGKIFFILYVAAPLYQVRRFQISRQPVKA